MPDDEFFGVPVSGSAVCFAEKVESCLVGAGGVVADFVDLGAEFGLEVIG